MLTLSGILIVIIGFVAGFNPLLVVTVAAIVTGLAGGLDLIAVISAFGKAFNDNRYVSIAWLVLPVIGLLERAGLKERAQQLIAKVQAATTGRVLMLYFIIRQLTAALGLTSLGGHAQMVRPLIAPMAEAASETRFGPLPDRIRYLIRAHAAAVDNIAVFFGEDIFIAIASILLIQGFLHANGIDVQPLQLSVWAIPTAIMAFLIHVTRLVLLDRRLKRELAGGEARSEAAAKEPAPVIKLTAVYVLAGLMFAGVSALSAADTSNPKRLKNTAFWGLLAVSFLFGSYLGDLGNGVLVLAVVGLAGIGGGLGRGQGDLPSPEKREASAKRWGNLLFVPALTIPAVALLGSLFLKNLKIGETPIIDPAQVTLVSLGLGVVVALIIAIALLRPPPLAPVQQARRLFDTVGWAVVLPQMLAALGAVFALAGVGRVVGELATQFIPADNRFFVVAAYTIGMALFTIIMGNGFAAFPVMTAGIGLPLIVTRYGGDPVVMGAVGMLSGFCGTLMTPMAANFNIVPAALLELPDRNGVIKVQIPTGLILLCANTVLMYLFVFHT